jgi:hypothetical protein
MAQHPVAFPAGTHKIQPLIGSHDEGWQAKARKPNSNAGNKAADLAGISNDLALVHRACARFVDCSQGGEEFGGDATHFFDSAVIRYRRCFNGGVRTLLTRKIVQDTAPDYINMHDYFMDLANKSVAHSVNHHEILEPTVYVDDNDQIKGHGIFAMRTQENALNVSRLGELAIILKDSYVTNQERLEREKFDRYFSGLKSEDLARLKPLLIPAAEGAVVSQARKRT